MLDTVIQATPLALVLTNDADAVLYSNSSARRLFAEGRKLEGDRFARYLERAPGPLREAIERGGDTLFTLEIGGEPEVYHVSQRSFLLNSLPHRLLLLKQLTREINSQEVATWKKVIRVIAHELNNSLAPISSLAHSGQILAQCPARSRTAAARVLDHRGACPASRGLHRGLCAVRQAAAAAPRARRLGNSHRATARGDLVPARRLPAEAHREFRHRADRAGLDQSAQECARIRRRSRHHRARRESRPRRASASKCGTAVPAFRARRWKARWCRSIPPSRAARASDSPCAARSSKRTAGACGSANRAGGGAMVTLWLPDGS